MLEEAAAAAEDGRCGDWTVGGMPRGGSGSGTIGSGASPCVRNKPTKRRWRERTAPGVAMIRKASRSTSSNTTAPPSVTACRSASCASMAAIWRSESDVSSAPPESARTVGASLSSVHDRPFGARKLAADNVAA